MSKTWFISGASAGIGRQLAEKLLERGDSVVGTSRQPESLLELEQRYPQRFMAVQMKLTEASDVKRAVSRAFGEMERIDVVVSNAGYGLFGAAEEATDDQIEQQIATNLLGSIHLIRAALPFLREQGGGRVVQVSSEGGQIAYPNFSYYHASKWGIEGFVESVAQEVMPFGIEFLIAEPGPTATNFGINLVQAEPTSIYENTPAGDVRRAMSEGTFEVKGDAGRTADQIIHALGRETLPKRLVLGSAAYTNIERTLTERLAELALQRDVAMAADALDS